MAGQQTRLAQPADEAVWTAFVAARPEATLCHHFGWKRVAEEAYGKNCYYLAAVDGERWSGVLPLVHMRSPLTGNRLVSLPFLDQGGVLAESPEAGNELWRAALDLARRLGVGGIDLRGGRDDDEALEPHRFRLLLELEDSADALWSSIGGKVRNQVRKSEKAGLETRRADPAELPVFYDVFARNMRDLGSPVHSRRYFETILSAFQGRCGLYLTFQQETPVAGGVALRFRDNVTVPWASSLRSARRACPNHSLYWKVLQDAQTEGARSFDFGRSAPDSGTFHFKKQWGAKPVPLRWSSYDGGGELQEARQLDPRRHAPLADLWRRLPLWLANRVGPRVRRHLSN